MKGGRLTVRLETRNWICLGLITLKLFFIADVMSVQISLNHLTEYLKINPIILYFLSVPLLLVNVKTTSPSSGARVGCQLRVSAPAAAAACLTHTHSLSLSLSLSLSVLQTHPALSPLRSQN